MLGNRTFVWVINHYDIFAGFTVNVERDAGLEAKFLNAAYEEAGAKMVDSNQAFDADIVLKVRAPTTKEVIDVICFISLRHSVNGDFCGHSRFVLWHENLTTFVS